MSRARDTAVRLAIIVGMTLCIAGLMQLVRTEQTTPPPAQLPQESKIAAMTDNWSGRVNFAPAYAALNPYRAETTQRPDTLFDPSDEYWGLPRKGGHETVAAHCAACHSLQIVMQQRQTRNGWDYLLTWMVEKQGMAEPPRETREEILDYLTREFGAPAE